MSDSLTPKQKNVLDFIMQFTGENGFAPTLEGIAQHFGLSSVGTVQQYIQALKSKGYLLKKSHVARGLQVVEKEIMLPLLGKVAAGLPIEYKKHDQFLRVPDQMLKSGFEHFLLQVQGDSMIDEGILDGDYVVIRKQNQAENYQIVVAQWNEQATIKRFVKKRNSIELHSANKKYKPIFVEDESSFCIEGLYCGLLRIKTD